MLLYSWELTCSLYMQLTWYVGHPVTWRLPAIEILHVLRILRDMDVIPEEILIRSITFSRLIKTLAKQGAVLITSPKVYESSTKLLNDDGENITRDVPLLHKLWSGDATAYTFATESTRDITANTRNTRRLFNVSMWELQGRSFPKCL